MLTTFKGLTYNLRMAPLCLPKKHNDKGFKSPLQKSLFNGIGKDDGFAYVENPSPSVYHLSQPGVIPKV